MDEMVVVVGLAQQSDDAFAPFLDQVYVGTYTQRMYIIESKLINPQCYQAMEWDEQEAHSKHKGHGFGCATKALSRPPRLFYY